MRAVLTSLVIDLVVLHLQCVNAEMVCVLVVKTATTLHAYRNN